MYESTDKMVSHPSHYQTKGGLEVIDVIKAFTEDLQGIQATDTGNIIKYACRWNKKGTPIRDVEKIIWYATHLLEELKREEAEKKSKYDGLLASTKKDDVNLCTSDFEDRTLTNRIGVYVPENYGMEGVNGTCWLLAKEDNE